ncbi:MAG: hypothetical protein WBB39_00245 [Candidatus Saccharimonadales bacterium]
MKRSLAITTIAGLLTAGLVGLTWVTTSHAQTPTNETGQALEIAPPVINLTANPGQIVEAKIQIRDVSTSNLLVRGEVNDFTAAGEDGTPKLLIEQTETSPYSLRPWISALPQLTLKPQQIESLPVTIKVPTNAAPGGYFAVIRFTASAPGIDQSGVALSASLGTLVLLRVNGDAKQQLSIESFYTQKDSNKISLIESAPLDFVVRIKNSGNVHEQPVGQARIKDMFGNELANVNINLERKNILPGSIRKFQEPLNSATIGNKILFGRYTAQLTMKYGDDSIVTSEISFWVIPYKLIIGVITGLILLFFTIRYALRRYTERVLDRSRRSRRR